MFRCIVCLLILLPALEASICEVCSCQILVYDSHKMFVTNCSLMGFTMDDVHLLEHLPDQVQVLLFTKNNIPVLPLNIFGSKKNFTNLLVIDMSDNKIEEIKGKTFHHAPAVERLILNHNYISLAKFPHPRVFSNFENLKELHLVDAFRDGPSGDLIEELHSIFITSNLTKLQKLHLEQNKIEKFDNPKFFCSLINLSYLYLSDNKLRNFNVDIQCLSNLRYLNLKGNEIVDFSKSELALFDSFFIKKGFFHMSIHSAYLLCDCHSNLHSWLQSTSVTIEDKADINCTCTNNENIILGLFPSSHSKDYNVSKRNFVRNPRQVSSVQTFTHIVVICISCFLIITLSIISLRYSFELCKHTKIPTGKIHYKVIRNSVDVTEIRF